jgi:hypothetical protein
MQHVADAHPFLFSLLLGICLWVAVSVLISYVGGWASLARRYVCSNVFLGDRWSLQSAPRCDGLPVTATG